MNGNTPTPEIPLHLCQVLEEEFENLHGPLDGAPPPAGGDEAPQLVVRQDWDFHAGHVSGDDFLGALVNARASWLKTHGGEAPPELGGVDDLYAFLAFRYLPDDAAAPAGATRPDAVELLRRILADLDMSEKGEPNGPGLSVYKRARFEHLTLRDETRGLLDLGWPEAGPETFDGRQWAAKDRERFAKSDLARFRRLLLEDAFPAPAIRRAYDLRLDRVIRRTHELPTKRTALCFSGGGIRSGTFALGIIQSLSWRRLLDKFDYLSTVSGGGYIGGWLTAWIHRHPHGLEGVVGELNGSDRASRLEPEPEPLQHLRDFSNFLTPRTGILSADTWTFVAIYVRNLLLNWVVLIPLLASVLMIPRVVNGVTLAQPRWATLAGLLVLGSLGIYLLKPDRRLARWLAVADAVLLLVIFLSSMGWLRSWGWNAPNALLVVSMLLGGYAMAYMRLNRPSNSGAIPAGSFWARHRGQSSFLWLCLLPLSISAMLLATYWAWFRAMAKNAESPGAVVLGGLFTVPELLGFLLYGAALGLIAWTIYLFIAETKRALRELAVTLSASLVGALLLYAFAVNIGSFYYPIAKTHGPSPFKGGGPDQLLPYTSWWNAEIYTCLAIPLYLLIFFLGITLFVGITSRRSERGPKQRREQAAAQGAAGAEQTGINLDRMFIEDEDREWLARASGWLFITLAGWLLLSSLVIFGPLLVFALPKLLAAVGGLSGLLTIIGGRSSLTPGNSKAEGKQSLLAALGVKVLLVASFVFCACLVIAVSLLTGALIAWIAKYLPPFPASYWPASWPWSSVPDIVEIPAQAYGDFKAQYPTSRENVFRLTHFPTWFYLLALALALQAFGRVFSQLVNLNKFSLHAGYRDRLIRAFLGASRLKGERNENPFTGFDPRDNLYMQELRPALLSESDFKAEGGLRQFAKYLKNPSDAPQEPAAKYLREEIERIEGESVDYLDQPESIDTNPSFRSALFADLNRILQDKARPLYGAEGKPFGDLEGDGRLKRLLQLPELRERGDYHILLSRWVLERTFPECLKASGYPPPPYRLLHVVNMTLNVVRGDRLAWQQRRATSFTSTALHSGSLFVGYRRTREYGGKSGISLGTAMAISGAAANSNMGYFTPSPFVTLVLTFFNARLGWWLGNPGVHGADTYFRSHPQKALSPILDEAFGLTNERNPYVLLSDGGHFENLGLYEMVLRRCRDIVVVDGSADPSGSYDDLGGAVRKIRIDLGIRIEFRGPFPILSRPESETTTGGYYAVGDIHYEDVDLALMENAHTNLETGEQEPRLTGRIVYIKPAIYGTEPRDIFNYAKGDPTFPHETTADQFFDEPQFESHRMLGYHILESLFGEAFPRATARPTLSEFVTRLEEGSRAKQAAAEAAGDKERKGAKDAGGGREDGKP